MRDPLVDPQPGDVVRLWFRDKAPWTRTVVGREGGTVYYRSSTTGRVLDEDVERWKLSRWSNSAQVVKVADES